MCMYVIGVEKSIRAVNVSEMPVSVRHVVSRHTIEHTRNTLLQRAAESRISAAIADVGNV